MPVEAFLDTCMERPDIFEKWQQASAPSCKDAFVDVPRTASTEKEIYDPLSLNRINPKNDDSKSRCPGFTFLDTSDSDDRHHGHLGSLKPDVCCYANHHLEIVQKDMKGKKSGPYRGRTVMGYAATFIEVKGSPSVDPFDDPPSDVSDLSLWQFVLNSETGNSATARDTRKMCFGQNIIYATEILARQHRQFLYSISLCGPMARFIRWDRAGAIVTEAFDIHRFPEHLCNFVWLFALMSDGQRGYDLTVELASRDEEKIFAEAICKHASTQAPSADVASSTFSADTLKMHYMSNHVTVVHVPEEDSSVVRRLLVSRPFVYPTTVFGKAWRTYWAVDTTVGEDHEHRVVLLKDTWREDPPPCGRRESDILGCLHDGVQTINLPKLVLSGDVKQRDVIPTLYPDHTIGFAVQDHPIFQSSRTQDFLTESWVCGSALRQCQTPQPTIRKHTHHRLVLSTPGHTLTQFTGTRELLYATFDVVKTLATTSEKHHIVHRNLSPRSIILYTDPKAEDRRRQGYLIDWDQWWDDRNTLDSSEAQYSPSLQFVCATLASGDNKSKYSVEDDLESLLYVVIYLAILWLPLNNRNRCASEAIRGMFQSWDQQSGRLVSLGKKVNKASQLHTEGLKWMNDSLQIFMDTMLNALQPLPDGGSGDYDGKPFCESLWICSNIKTIWESFLCEHRDKLPTMDKESSLPLLEDMVNGTPRNLIGDPYFPTMSSRGTKRDRSQFISDGAATSVAGHMGVQLTLDAPLSNETLPDDDSETLPDLQASEHSDLEDGTVSKRRRVEVETVPGSLTGAEGPSQSPHAMLSSTIIPSIIDLTGPVIQCVPGTFSRSVAGSNATQPPRDGSAPTTLNSTKYPFPDPIVAWDVDLYNLAKKSSE
uniref:N/A n=1 Tax=Ganoderma boninense TaxID=34458 RepID=A0A5K1K7D5_9APHY|nr:N/A [Ganoderma boninense]